ncbi:ParB N-terminal domain-containing protein [Amycolatopsis jiangsuensis]|uniref:Plasmid stabilization system protein ParE n=1 Tax=Amycolatopsis jiangsuensis TaxID=1181879 RepID=A0A840J2C8_9PSEU|nr:hypothetical protein [Amycolatopsis jiangsuensis]MBB4687568.1 plasmid stabilization system protein ParE [Amycolatopsis jiangsuensis]
MERVTITGGAGFLELNTGGRVELPQSLRIALATGQLRRPLADTLRAVLALLVDGDYRVNGPERLTEAAALVPATEWPEHDHARVTYYRAAIRSGHLPVAIVLSGARALLLDGHHKITAYRAEGVPASVVRISAAQPEYSDS